MNDLMPVEFEFLCRNRRQPYNCSDIIYIMTLESIARKIRLEFRITILNRNTSLYGDMVSVFI